MATPCGLRGLSELVSAALLVIIVVTLGTMVVARIIESTYTGLQAGQAESLRQVAASRQALGVMLATLDPQAGRVTVYIVTGDFPVGLQAVYVNDTLADCNVTWAQGGGVLNGETTVTIPYYTVARIDCPAPQRARLARVKLVYEGGEVTVLASPS